MSEWVMNGWVMNEWITNEGMNEGRKECIYEGLNLNANFECFNFDLEWMNERMNERVKTLMNLNNNF